MDAFFVIFVLFSSLVVLLCFPWCCVSFCFFWFVCCWLLSLSLTLRLWLLVLLCVVVDFPQFHSAAPSGRPFCLVFCVGFVFCLSFARRGGKRQTSSHNFLPRHQSPQFYTLFLLPLSSFSFLSFPWMPSSSFFLLILSCFLLEVSFSLSSFSLLVFFL